MTYQDRQYKWYSEHKEALLSLYRDKWLVIQDSDVRGVFNFKIDAWEFASSKYAPGAYLLIHCEKTSPIIDYMEQ